MSQRAGELKIASHVFTCLREIIVTQSVNEKMNNNRSVFCTRDMLTTSFFFKNLHLMLFHYCNNDMTSRPFVVIYGLDSPE